MIPRRRTLTKSGGIHKHGLSGLYLGLLLNKQRTKTERDNHQELMLDDEKYQKGYDHNQHYNDDTKSHLHLGAKASSHRLQFVDPNRYEVTSVKRMRLDDSLIKTPFFHA